VTSLDSFALLAIVVAALAVAAALIDEDQP
jgi:hypothetical protein